MRHVIAVCLLWRNRVGHSDKIQLILDQAEALTHYCRVHDEIRDAILAQSTALREEVTMSVTKEKK